MNHGRRLLYTPGLVALIILGAIAPQAALAQLGLGSLIVTVTAPSNGANVSGTIPVSASVTIVGGLTVQSVQFKLDGANLGAADTSAPYAISWDTRTASNASHTITAVARDVLGAQWTSNTVTVTVFNDTTPPSVSITSPTAGTTVSGTITMRANATDNVGVVGVQFQVDGVNAGAEATAAPYSAQWNTLGAANGSHTVTAIARDAAGNRASSAVTVSVFNDTTPPSVSITSPTAGTTVSGTITMTANATDNVGVVGVQFQVDGVNAGAEATAAPYSAQWNTLGAANGSHTVTAIARDAAGNRASSAVTVTVFNDTTPPSVSITSPTAGTTVSGTVTMTANASDNVGVVGVQFQVDGVNAGAEATAAPYSAQWNTLGAANGSHTVTAIARDAAGNRASSAVTVTVFNDTTPPSVSITSPTAGTTVSGTITMTANATDNVGVVGVQFQVDGVNAGAEATAAPYSAQWNTLNATNGSHTVSAIARDAAGNSTTSAAVTVTVFNDTTPPSVSITSPAAGATVSGNFNVAANATDNVGVAGVQFKLDGANLGAEVTAAPYQVSWDTTTATNAAHTLSAVARDAAGNQSTSAVSVTVSNLSPVAIENQQPGSDNWGMWFGGMPADDVGKQIKGYASATSVNKGDSITFYVSATASTYTIDFYRMGYYQGHGGRLVQSIGPLAAVQQPLCPADINTGLTECNWAASYTLAVPTSWTSGIFLAKLTSSAGFQNWIVFVVRDDARQTPLVYKQPVNTYQAYNDYPNDNATGKSLYAFNSFGAPTVSGQARAVKVSFNRPYADRGAGQFFNWEYYFVRWIERTGYDVKYTTTVDLHEHGVPAGTKGLLSIAHDEYWSKEMYDAAEAARAAGISMGFFGGNGVYWQVRFEPSPLTGVADRVMVGYKDRTTDPVQGPTTTILWRDPFINRPEQTLMGVQFNGQIDFSTPNVPFVVQNSTSWVYTGTGVHDGDQIPGIVGYEMDGSWADTPQPNAIAGTYTIVGASPYTDVGGGPPKVSNATIYQAPSGAWVFGAGTTSWAWGLDLAGTADARIQRMTSNILDRFVGKTN